LGLEKRRKFHNEFFFNFRRLTSNVGAVELISPDGLNSFELKKQKKIPRFQMGALLFTFLFGKEPFKYLGVIEILVDQGLQLGIYESTPRPQEQVTQKDTVIPIYGHVLRFEISFVLSASKTVLRPVTLNETTASDGDLAKNCVPVGDIVDF